MLFGYDPFTKRNIALLQKFQLADMIFPRSERSSLGFSRSVPFIEFDCHQKRTINPGFQASLSWNLELLALLNNWFNYIDLRSCPFSDSYMASF